MQYPWLGLSHELMIAAVRSEAGGGDEPGGVHAEPEDPPDDDPPDEDPPDEDPPDEDPPDEDPPDEDPPDEDPPDEDPPDEDPPDEDPPEDDPASADPLGSLLLLLHAAIAAAIPTNVRIGAPRRIQSMVMTPPARRRSRAPS